jgi:DtxR family Mn-dependent transcriptional regulator
MNTYTEENYLKAIYKFLENGEKKISTSVLAKHLGTAPASVTDMLQRLSEKKLISYEKYKGVSLTAAGKKIAVAIIRKHRLWEYFLVKKLGCKWDEVHEMAEQLEHVRSDELIEKLDQFLGRPRFDPHGDPIPDEHGRFQQVNSIPLSQVGRGEKVSITGVLDHGSSFLKYLSKHDISIGQKVIVKDIQEFDKSMDITLHGKSTRIHISSEVAKNLLVTQENS